MDKFEVKLDQAARAAWMSYVGGMTQDEIATQLGVSRPGVQRLLALARQEGLVKVHIDHPISTCMALGCALREHFNLTYCDVVPADTQAPDSKRHSRGLNVSRDSWSVATRSHSRWVPGVLCGQRWKR